MSTIRLSQLCLRALQRVPVRNMSGEWGSGVGKGGGTGGTVREAGGSFGLREVALEEQYFRKLQEEQLKALREHLEEEVRHHELQIKQHQECIDRHKKKITNIRHNQQQHH